MKVELPDDCLEIGQAAGEGKNWYDVSITGCRERGKAEIKHRGNLLGAFGGSGNIGEGGGAEFPDQSVDRRENGRDIQIQYGCPLKAAECDATGGINRVRNHPGQRREGENVTAATKHALSDRGRLRAQ